MIPHSSLHSRTNSLLPPSWRTARHGTKLLRTLLPIVVTLSACFRVELGPFETPPEVSSLVESASRHIALTVTNPLSDSSHGYQFLLFAIPVTRVFPNGLADLTASKLTMYAGFAGNGLHQGPGVAHTSPRIDARVESVSVNGYDLLVTRRPSASITLSATLYNRDSSIRKCEAHGSFSKFSKFAFEEDLKYVLDRATDAAARDLLECLGLFDAREFEAVHGKEIV